MKRFFALLLAAVMVLSLAACSNTQSSDDPQPSGDPQPDAPVPDKPQIASGTCSDTIRWVLYEDGTLTVSGSGAIPDYEKDADTQPWAEYRKVITELVVEDGITRIGRLAFLNCTKIKKAVLGKSVTSVGEWAFQNCFAMVRMEVEPQVQFESGALRSTPVEWDIGAVDSDLYKSSPFYAALCKVELTGNYREDVINVALSQLGYHEGNSEADYAGGNADGSKDYTEYGRYLNSIGRAWCSEFASWCIRKAGVPLNLVANSRGANAYTFTKNSTAVYYTWDQTVYGGGSYTPRPGDVLLWDWDYKEYSFEQNVSHTSLLRSVEVRSDGSLLFHSIDGNSGGRVREREYHLNPPDGNLLNREGRLYYIVSPDY